MRFPLVMKFGGDGLADGASVRHACMVVQRITDCTPVVVVSAHAGVTEELERCAQRAGSGEVNMDRLRIRHKSLMAELGVNPELLDRLLMELGQVLYAISGRRRVFAEEMDFVLSFGERMSARIVAAALRNCGVQATPVDAHDLGLTTDSSYGHARPLPGMEQGLRRSLHELSGVPVVTGFLAKDRLGNLTTLGRNGSDLTAALVARAVHAERLIFFKSVPGIMDADPSLVSGATVLPAFSIEEASALAFHGASVLHPSTLHPLLGTRVNVEVRHIRTPDVPGTCLNHQTPSPHPLAVTGFSDLEGLRVRNDSGETTATLFALQHANHVQPRYLNTSVQAITMYAPKTPGLGLMRQALGDRGEVLSTLASVALIGGAKSGAGSRALEVLKSHGVEPVFSQLSTSGLCQLFMVVKGDQQLATRALHSEWFASVRA